MQVARLHPHGPTGVVLEGAAGDGDHAAGTDGIQAVVILGVAVIAEERVAHYHPAVVHVQAIVRIDRGTGAYLADHLTALDAHLSGQHAAHRDVAPCASPQNAVVLTRIAHHDLVQLTRAPVKDQARPLVRSTVRGRGEGNGLGRCAHRLQVASYLQLSAALPHHHRARLHGQGDSRGDHEISGQDVGATSKRPGGVSNDSSADVGFHGCRTHVCPHAAHADDDHGHRQRSDTQCPQNPLLLHFAIPP